MKDDRFFLTTQGRQKNKIGKRKQANVEGSSNALPSSPPGLSQTKRIPMTQIAKSSSILSEKH